MGPRGREVVGWPVVGIPGVPLVKYSSRCDGWEAPARARSGLEADVILCVGMLAERTELYSSERSAGMIGHTFHTLGTHSSKKGLKNTSKRSR
jgi:hypothetical protein